jgi:hypothetical protein
MKNISKKVNLRTRVDAAMFVITINRINGVAWGCTWDISNDIKKIESTYDVCKEIENKLEK